MWQFLKSGLTWAIAGVLVAVIGLFWGARLAADQIIVSQRIAYWQAELQILQYRLETLQSMEDYFLRFDDAINESLMSRDSVKQETQKGSPTPKKTEEEVNREQFPIKLRSALLGIKLYSLHRSLFTPSSQNAIYPNYAKLVSSLEAVNKIEAENRAGTDESGQKKYDEAVAAFLSAFVSFQDAMRKYLRADITSLNERIAAINKDLQDKGKYYEIVASISRFVFAAEPSVANAGP
jgi:hypothetical protein